MVQNSPPLVFVAMPFGKKKDLSKSFKIDFDLIYDKAIKPIESSDDLEIDILRADEEKLNGIIHLPMFERLLLSEIVIADVTNQNPNVYYELGIRHCARPKTTILIYASHQSIPFDIAPIRAIPYKVISGKISDGEAQRLQDTIKERLVEALSSVEEDRRDSPIFDLIREWNPTPLSIEKSQAFKEVSKVYKANLEEIKNSREIDTLLDIENNLTQVNEINLDLYIQLLFSYRDLKAWDQMINLIENRLGLINNNSQIIELKALALNRRNNGDDYKEAITILDKLIEKYGNNPETNGILGRIYKDRYDENINKPDIAEAFLDRAIESYRLGFEIDPRDFYPGINLLTLLAIKKNLSPNEPQLDFETIKHSVLFSLNRIKAIDSKDYWTVASLMEVAVHLQDRDLALKCVGRLLTFNNEPWYYESTCNNLQLLSNSYPDDTLISELIEKIEARE